MTRIAVVGLGPIGSLHVDNLLGGKIKDTKLVAICEQRPVDDPKFNGIKIYKDIDEMLAQKDEFDAVIISTPSFTHYPLAKKSLEAGFHTLVEKPIALCTADAQELMEISKRTGKICAIMLNQRTTPLYARIKELVDNGDVGEIHRVSWTMSNWYRPDIYFTSSPWRGTWKGEAGGVLINQSIHNIDIWAWIFGLPKSLRAWCKYGKYHSIEVEDEVTCVMQLENGATASFITSTGEYPGANRLLIAGDKAFILAENDKLTITRYKDGSITRYTHDTKYVFGSPETEVTEESFADKGLQHVGVVNNFVGAIRGECTLDYESAEGKLSLAMANAMLMSSWLEKEVEFPFSDAEYKKLLDSKIATSKLRENPKTDFIIDFNKSFK